MGRERKKRDESNILNAIIRVGFSLQRLLRNSEFEELGGEYGAELLCFDDNKTGQLAFFFFFLQLVMSC